MTDVGGSVSSMLRGTVVGLVGIALCFSCGRRNAPSPAPGESQESRAQPVLGPRCFEVVARDNSPSTRKVFRAKRCQGGGVTWAAIMEGLIRGRGPSKAIEAETPGWTGDVRTLSWKGKTIRVAIDDEGDSARFCTDSDQLLAEVRSDLARLNADAAELERRMGEADPLAMECSPDDLSPLMGGMAPEPSPPPAEARARETSLARLRSTLAKQRTWCWRKSGTAFGGKGGFTLHADGNVTEFGAGRGSGSGRWSLEDDGRIQVLGGGLHDFDVGESGNLGFNHSSGREELDACSAPRGSIK